MDRTRNVVVTLTGISMMLLVALVALWLTSVNQPALAAKPELSTPGTSVMLDPRLLAQAPLVDAADRIQRLARSSGFDGLAGTRLYHKGHAVIVYWKGPLPATIAETIDQMRNGVGINVVNVPYTGAELDREARRIARLNGKGLSITGVGPAPDFRGLQVYVGSPEDLVQAQSMIASPVALMLTIRTGRTIPFFNRWNDTSPFWGGAAIETPIGGNLVDRCSTGFAVQKPGGPEGITTARHCGDNTGYTANWRTADGHITVGNMENGSASLDATVLTGQDYDPRIYVGTWNEDPPISRFVQDYTYPSLDQYVIISGSASGAWVVKVWATNQYDTDGVGPGFWTTDEEGDGSAGVGDSGGPVVMPGNGASKVLALGMIKSGWEPTLAPCEGNVWPGRECTFEAFHVNIGEILSGLNLTLQTN